MTDIVSPKRRSEIMRSIRGKNTSPELTIRKFLRVQGVRYRLHDSQLPGTPDIILPGLKICIFVHGCFWHGCSVCADGVRKVKSNREYWLEKIQANQRRDRLKQAQLRKAGWRVLVIWECKVGNATALARLVKQIGIIPKSQLKKKVGQKQAHAGR